MAAGGLHMVALTGGGVLWVWSYGFFGQLGLGDFNKRLVPTRLGVGEAFGAGRWCAWLPAGASTRWR